MTDGGTRVTVDALRRVVVSEAGIVALLGLGVLIIGLFVGTPVGQVVCGLLFVAAMVTAYWKYRRRDVLPRDDGDSVEETTADDRHPTSPRDTMKKLLFDDYQSSRGPYVVKEINETEAAVIPATRSMQAAPTVAKEEVREFAVGDFFDLDSDIYRTETEPSGEFNFLVGKLLGALQEVLFAHTVAFFWVNREKAKLVLEAHRSPSPHFCGEKKYDLGNDLVSQVAADGKPKFVGRVQEGTLTELVPYYTSGGDVRSVVAVPVFYLDGTGGQAPVAVIVADSTAEDAFGPETLLQLGNFTKLASALVKSYTDKYDLLLDAELLASIRRMQDRLKSEPAEPAVLNALAEEANRLVRWDALAVVMYSEDAHGWAVQKVVNRAGIPYVEQGYRLDFEESIAGSAVRANQVRVVDDLAALQEPRFAAREELERRGSVVVVPMSSLSRCYGAVVFESRNERNFAGTEVETLYRLVENAAGALDVIYMNDLVRDHVVVDQLTGSFTRKHFLTTIENEVARADDYSQELALVSVAVDGMKDLQARYGREGFDAVMAQVARVIRGQVRPYDCIGRLDEDRIGVLLVHTAASDAYLWAEKVRTHVASQVMTLGPRTISVTVSAGVCGMMDGMAKEDLLGGTGRMLQQAIENGGNLVRVY
jgi:diguanylate cyclase (GGDEF)-like protein